MDLSFKTYSHNERPEGIPFSDTLGNTYVKAALTAMKNFVIIFLCRPDLVLGTIATQLKNINMTEVLIIV